MAMHTRRAGEEEGSHNDRRVDVLNQHEVRLSILEASHKESVDARNAHSRAIEELNRNLHETATALREGISAFASKVDTLIAQIKIGFYVVSLGTTVVVFLFGAFMAYNKELDEKYINHSKKMSEQIESTELDVQNLQNKKVIKASK